MPSTTPHDIVSNLQPGTKYLFKTAMFVTPFDEQVPGKELERVFIEVSKHGFGHFEEGKAAFIRVQNEALNSSHLIYIPNIESATEVCPKRPL